MALLAVSALAQAPNGALVTRLVNEQGDTVVTKRTVGDWRIGPTISGTLHYHFGKLFIPKNNEFPGHGYYRLEGGGVGGGGFAFGLSFTYQPADERWGFAMITNLYDYRSTTSYTRIYDNPPVDSRFALDNNVVFHPSVTYVNFMPQARYNFDEYPGLHLLMGIDLDLLIDKSAYRWNTNYNNERIDVQRRVTFSPEKFRLGVNVGAGYDMFGGTFDSWRMTVTGFTTLHVGSNVFTRYGSNWNSVYLRGGVAVTFGEDEMMDTLIRRDPNFNEPQAPMIALKDDGKMNVVMPESKGMFIAMLVPNIPGDAIDKPDYEHTIGSRRAPAAAGSLPNTPGAATNVRISPNSQRVFSSYATPFDTSLTTQLRSYLDAVADYLQANPRAEVRIVGHADNFGGSPTETQRISDERALQVVRYLQRKGISRDRLLASGLGSRRPVQDNRSPRGRAANRRVEITIVQ